MHFLQSNLCRMIGLIFVSSLFYCYYYNYCYYYYLGVQGTRESAEASCSCQGTPCFNSSVFEMFWNIRGSVTLSFCDCDLCKKCALYLKKFGKTIPLQLKMLMCDCVKLFNKLLQIIIWSQLKTNCPNFSKHFWVIFDEEFCSVHAHIKSDSGAPLFICETGFVEKLVLSLIIIMMSLVCCFS